MLIVFAHRLRLPWRGGAKRISPEAVVPALVVPFMICFAAINGYAAIIMLITLCGIIGYGFYLVQKAMARTRFFFMWIFWSVLYMIVLFELTFSLLELLPEENLALVLLTIAAIACLWRTRKLAPLNHVIQSTAKDELPGITEATAAEEEEEAQQTALLLENDLSEDTTMLVGHQPNICESCRKYMPPRTDHCAVCGACIKRRDHHSYWLDCCIGERNHRYYLAALILAILALLLGANLTLTAVCHPFLLVRVFGIPLMLPDDCSEVFADFQLAISFVVAGYALVISIYILAMFIRQVYLISRGITMQEFKRGQCSNRKTLWSNWRSFIF